MQPSIQTLVNEHSQYLAQLYAVESAAFYTETSQVEHEQNIDALIPNGLEIVIY